MPPPSRGSCAWVESPVGRCSRRKCRWLGWSGPRQRRPLHLGPMGSHRALWARDVRRGSLLGPRSGDLGTRRYACGTLAHRIPERHQRSDGAYRRGFDSTGSHLNGYIPATSFRNRYRKRLPTTSAIGCGTELRPAAHLKRFYFSAMVTSLLVRPMYRRRTGTVSRCFSIRRYR